MGASLSKKYIEEGSHRQGEVINGGAIEQTYKFQWILQNFNTIFQCNALIDAQHQQVTAGMVEGTRLEWELLLTRKEENWMGIELNLLNNLRDVNNNILEASGASARFSVKLLESDRQTGKKWVFFEGSTGVKALRPISGSGFPQILRLNRSCDHLLLENGSLVVHIELKVYSSRNRRHEIPQRRDFDFAGNMRERELASVQTLAVDFARLYDTRAETGDIQIVVRMPPDDNAEIPMHRQVLMARSTRFAEDFRQQAAGQQQPNNRFTNINHIPSRTMELLVSYLYKCQLAPVQELNAADMIELAYAAHMFGLRDLLQFLDEVMAEKCTRANASCLFTAAEELDLNGTRRNILEFVKSTMREMTDEEVANLIRNPNLRRLNGGD